MKKLLVVLALVAMPALAGDSYVFVQNGRTITNGAPINVKALRAKYNGSFLWFSLDRKSYITRDPKVLARIGPLYNPLFSTDLDFTVGEQAKLLSQQARLLQEQLRIGLDAKAGEDAATAVRRTQLRVEQNRLAQRQNELAARANAAAVRANEYAAHVNELNLEIERALHDVAAQLVKQGLATKE